MSLADDAVSGIAHTVWLAEAITQAEFVKSEIDEFAAALREDLPTFYDADLLRTPTYEVITFEPGWQVESYREYTNVIQPVIDEHLRRIRLRESNTAMLLFGWHM